VSKQIKLAIPAGTRWPVKCRDPKTGEVVLAPGFLEIVAQASGLALGDDGTGRPRLSEDMVSELLLQWYIARREIGEPECPVVETLIREARRESMH